MVGSVSDELNALQNRDAVVEFGTNEGDFLRSFKDGSVVDGQQALPAGVSVIGFDINSEALEIARNKNPDIEFVEADISRPDPPNPIAEALAGKKIQVSFASHTLEHLSQTQLTQFFKNLDATLADDGVLTAIVPAEPIKGIFTIGVAKEYLEAKEARKLNWFLDFGKILAEALRGSGSVTGGSAAGTP